MKSVFFTLVALALAAVASGTRFTYVKTTKTVKVSHIREEVFPGEYIVIADGPCPNGCPEALAQAFQDNGMKGCRIEKIVRIKNEGTKKFKSYITAKCLNVPTAEGLFSASSATKETFNFAMAQTASVGLINALNKNKGGVVIENVSPNAKTFALCPDHSPNPDMPGTPINPVNPTLPTPTADAPTPAPTPGVPLPTTPLPATPTPQPVPQPGQPDPVPAGLWGVDELDSNMDGNRCPSSSKKGEGVHLYVLDSGCDADAGATCSSYVNGEPGCADENGHGTHVGGTMTGKMYGVATKATRHCMKVLGKSGSGSYTGMVEALSEVARQCVGKKCVVNMSLGGPAAASVNSAVVQTASANVIIVVAGGNENKDACSTSPASAAKDSPFAFSVAAHDQGHNPASFTNYGPCTDLSAPGVQIQSDNGKMSGTSMAAPHVAGAAGVLLSDGKAVTLEALTMKKEMISRIDKPMCQFTC